MRISFTIVGALWIVTAFLQICPTDGAMVTEIAKNGGTFEKSTICTFCDPPSTSGTSCCTSCSGVTPPSGYAGTLFQGCSSSTPGSWSCTSGFNTGCNPRDLFTIYRYTNSIGDHLYSQYQSLSNSSYGLEKALGLCFTPNGPTNTTNLVLLMEYTATFGGFTHHFYSTSGTDVPSGYSYSSAICWMYATTNGPSSYPVYRYSNAMTGIWVLTLCPYDVGTSFYWILDTVVGYMLIRNE